MEKKFQDKGKYMKAQDVSVFFDPWFKAKSYSLILCVCY